MWTHRTVRHNDKCHTKHCCASLSFLTYAWICANIQTQMRLLTHKMRAVSSHELAQFEDIRVHSIFIHIFQLKPSSEKGRREFIMNKELDIQPSSDSIPTFHMRSVLILWFSVLVAMPKFPILIQKWGYY